MTTQTEQLLLSGEAATAQESVRTLTDLVDRTAALNEQVGWLRSQADLVHSDAADLHHETQSYDLQARAASKARRGVPALLAELSDRGMAWADIARLVGVSVSAVRKWRADGPASPESRWQLAELAAFLDLLADYPIDDPAQWMEMNLPLPAGFRVTPMELYRDGAHTALLDFATERLGAAELLDKVRPQWRSLESDFEVYDAEDGAKALRVRGH